MSKPVSMSTTLPVNPAPETQAAHNDMSHSTESLLAEAQQRAVRYLDGLDSRPVFPSATAVAALPALGGPLPEQPGSALETLALMDNIGSPATVATAGRRYFGYVVGGAIPVTLAANWLAGAWDQVAGLRVMSPAAAAFDDIAVEWLIDILGLSEAAGGALVTGATMANFSGLLAARHHLLDRLGWDVEAKGLFGAPELRVVVGAEVHGSMRKSLGLAGLGRERVEEVPVDGQGRMRADALPKLDSRTILCLQAGNVNTGAFDPAADILPAAREAGAWVHVDGAFGLWAAASPHYRHLMEGYRLADSWATDGHKWLNVPYDSGILITRHPDALRQAMVIQGAYLKPSDEREPCHYTPDSSRRARGIEIWAALRTLGRAGIADLVERTCRFAQIFAARFREAGLTVLNDVVLNQVMVSFGDAAQTQAVINDIQDDGTCWCSGTVWQGHTAMRVSVSSWATTEVDVERSAESIIRAARRVGR